MKKNLFILAASAFLVLGGMVLTACDNDDPDPTPGDDVGKKTITIKVVNESDLAASANVSITKGGTKMATVGVSGTYSYDVTTASSGTVFKFKATQEGYIDSDEESITLDYSNPSESSTSTIKLQITKKGNPVTLSPSQNNTFNVPTATGGSVKVNVPAGAVNRSVTLTPTSIPTAASKGKIAADSPNRSFSLRTIDLESDWSGSFLNGQKATFTFPLTQGLIDATVKKGTPLLFGSNSSGQWESYPVVVNESTLTGTVSIPHFSRWYLTTDLLIDVQVTLTPFEALSTSSCGQAGNATFTKTNAPVPEFYQQLFGWDSFPDVNATFTTNGENSKYWIIRGRCLQNTATVSGVRADIPNYTYFREPVTFASTAFSCTHNGGGGE